jgi:uncharacterized protein YoxC
MSRDFDQIIKEIGKSHKELSQNSNSLEKDILHIQKDIDSVKKSIKEIDRKVDELIEIMGNLTMMFIEDEEENDDSIYDSDQTWVPEDSDWKETDDEY